MELIERLREKHPSAWRACCIAVSAAMLLAAFMSLPRTPFYAATGITTLQSRVSAAQQAGYWATRAVLNPDGRGVAPTNVYATLLGVDERRRLLVSEPQGDVYVTASYAFADVQVTDVHGAAAVVAQHRFSDVRLDVYPGKQAVAWLDGQPLNLSLIAAGVAAADRSPETNIVDRAFAAYYWRMARKGEGK